MWNYDVIGWGIVTSQGGNTILTLGIVTSLKLLGIVTSQGGNTAYDVTGWQHRLYTNFVGVKKVLSL